VTLQELTDEMHALRFELKDEHPVSSTRVTGLITELEGFLDWLHEQNRLNRCIQRVVAQEPKEGVTEGLEKHMDPETIKTWVKNGWVPE
jgi:hypothetical protein